MRSLCTSHGNSEILKERAEVTLASCSGHLNMFHCFQFCLGRFFHAQHFIPLNTSVQLNWGLFTWMPQEVVALFFQTTSLASIYCSFNAPVHPPTWPDSQQTVHFDKAFGTDGSMNNMLAGYILKIPTVCGAKPLGNLVWWMNCLHFVGPQKPVEKCRDEENHIHMS